MCCGQVSAWVEINVELCLLLWMTPPPNEAHQAQPRMAPASGQHRPRSLSTG